VTTFAAFNDVVRQLCPRMVVVLGSGQSSVLTELNVAGSIEFAGVPGLGVPTVAGHSGKIVVGELHGVPILVFQGRLHFYEGHAWDKVASPINLAAQLGIRTVLLTNAAGGIHPALEPGTMMILRDDLFLQRPDAWKSPRPDGIHGPGPSRPSKYSPVLIDRLTKAAGEMGEQLLCGVYAAVTGPCYETPTEIHAMQAMGVDAVGMSTAFEAETAVAQGMEVAAISAITNRGAGLSEGSLHHHDVLDIMAVIRPRLGSLIARFVLASAEPA